MKKISFALCTLAAAMSSAYAQSNVTIYGIMDAGVFYTPKAAVAGTRGTHRLIRLDSGDMQQSRLGFRGTEDLGGGLKASFVLEEGFSIDNGQSGQLTPTTTPSGSGTGINNVNNFQTGALYGRASYVGLSSPAWGSVQIGRRKDFTDTIATLYSSVEDFGSFINGPHVQNLDRVGGNRANNQIRYDTPDLAGFVGNVTYAFGENSGGIHIGESWGFGGTYSNGPFSVGGAYWTAKTGTNTNNVTNGSDMSGSAACFSQAGGAFGPAGTTCLKMFVVGASYKTDLFRVFGEYANVKQPNAQAAAAAGPAFATTFTSSPLTGTFSAGGTNNDKTDVFDLGVDYHLTHELKLTASVNYSKNHFLALNTTTSGHVEQLNLAADYDFSKRTDAYVFLSTQRTKDMYAPGIMVAPGVDNSQVATLVGLRHKF